MGSTQDPRPNNPPTNGTERVSTYGHPAMKPPFTGWQPDIKLIPLEQNRNESVPVSLCRMILKMNQQNHKRVQAGLGASKPEKNAWIRQKELLENHKWVKQHQQIDKKLKTATTTLPQLCHWRLIRSELGQASLPSMTWWFWTLVEIVKMSLKRARVSKHLPRFLFHPIVWHVQRAMGYRRTHCVPS